MSYEFHERLQMERPARRMIRFALAWSILFAIDCCLFCIGYSWRVIRAESNRILR